MFTCGSSRKFPGNPSGEGFPDLPRSEFEGAWGNFAKFLQGKLADFGNQAVAMTGERKRVYLLSGGPGTGKTTLIRELAAKLGGAAGGFYTEEMRERGVRQGFRLITLGGEEATLAHISIGGPYRVGKYGVDVEALERVGVSALREAIRSSRVIVVDEIGKMELYSLAFREAVLEAMGGGKRVLGTIMLKPHPWADRLKRRPEVEVVTVTRENREQVLARLKSWLIPALGS